MSNEPSSFLQEFKWVWKVAGVLATAASLISLIQKVFRVGLNASLAELVRYYRNLLAPITDTIRTAVQFLLLHLNIQWRVPDWYSDALILSGIGAVIAARGQSKFISDIFRNRWIASGILVVTMTLSTITLYGLISLVIVIAMMFVFLFSKTYFGLFSEEAVRFGTGGKIESAREQVIATFKRIAILGWATLAGVAAFYVLNHVLQISL